MIQLSSAKIDHEYAQGPTSNVVALLQQARMNEDVEVVHYATVMLAELHKEYDLRYKNLSRIA